LAETDIHDWLGVDERPVMQDLQDRVHRYGPIPAPQERVKVVRRRLQLKPIRDAVPGNRGRRDVPFTTHP